MNIDEIKQNPISIENLVDFFYPVGSYLYTSNTSFNPEIDWGVGDWERVTDKFLRGVEDSNIGKELGNDSVTLTLNELPEHSHSALINESGSNSGTTCGMSWSNLGTQTQDGTIFSKATSTGNYANYVNASGGQGSSIAIFRSRLNNIHNHTIDIYPTGSGNSFSIIPSSIGVVIWHRIS